MSEQIVEPQAVEEEPSVTMIDILELQKELEEESAAVLGGSDEKCCTYSKGYIKRQALYSCLTCCPDARNDVRKSAGICLACSYQCHENHELVELYTKRKFRCDCPTIRNSGKKCSFTEAAENHEENAANIYNQNFSGLYCVCKKPYPDPDDSVQDVMVQCVICEDWYHTRHLEAIIPKSDSYSELICGMCMQAYSFLQDYTGLAVNKIEGTSESVDVSVLEEDDKLKSELDKSISDIMNISQSAPDTSGNENEAEPSSKKAKLDEGVETCRRPSGPNGYKKGAIFWPDNWRESLCKCSKCTRMYNLINVTFLLDPEDTVLHYEQDGLKKVRESEYECGVRALSTMDRVKQIDAITEYNKMKDKLMEFLHSFAVNKKVVTQEDINSFFQRMKNEKNADLGIPHFCR